jgi:prepilin-type N-terminal cleavage/methylation domain-containing protein
MLKSVKDNKGFTFIELMMVMIMAGILMQMAWLFALDLKKRGSDIAAVADGRNLITTVRNNFVNLDSVNYNATKERHIGIRKRTGGKRPPVFILSPGVMARIEAGSQSGIADQGYFEAFLFHRNGTGDETPSGKREFWYLADEANDIYSLPLF